MALDQTSVVTRGGGFIEAEVDGEVVVLNVDRGVCYGFNEVATRVWRLIAEPRRVADVCATLVCEYVVDQGTCEQQVLGLLEELHAEGVIGLRDEPAAR